MENASSEPFLTYVKIYSTSDAESETTPSSAHNGTSAKYIFQELKDLGLSDIFYGRKWLHHGVCSFNISENEPIRFYFYIMMPQDFNGKMLNPQIWEDYNGGDAGTQPRNRFHTFF